MIQDTASLVTCMPWPQGNKTSFHGCFVISLSIAVKWTLVLFCEPAYHYFKILHFLLGAYFTNLIVAIVSRAKTSVKLLNMARVNKLCGNFRICSRLDWMQDMNLSIVGVPLKKESTKDKGIWSLFNWSWGNEAFPQCLLGNTIPLN